MEALPKIVRQRLQVGRKPGAHPQADLLTAFSEKRLSEKERTRVVEHLSRCEDCREVVFLSAPSEEQTQLVGAMPTRAGWLSWPVLRWGVAVACVAVVGTAVTLHRQSLNRADLREKALSENALSVAPAAVPAESVAALRKSDSIAPTLPAEKLVAAQPGKDAAEDKQVAKFEAPVRPGPKAMTATPNLPMRFDQSRQINSDEVAGPVVAGGDASNVVPPPAPALRAKAGLGEAREESDKKQALADQSIDATTVSGQKELKLQATSSAPAQTAGVEFTNKTNSRDLASGDHPVSAAAAAAPAPAAAGSLTYGLPQLQKAKTDSGSAKLTARWMLDSNGALQRSWNAGNTWETVSVAEHASFQTLAAFVTEVWVGGANGILYHSSDSGQHWTHVIPTSKGEALTAGIIHIQFGDVQNGKVTTTNGEIWTTTDAGKTWQKN